MPGLEGMLAAPRASGVHPGTVTSSSTMTQLKKVEGDDLSPVDTTPFF
jgi:hypothetical protein